MGMIEVDVWDQTGNKRVPTVLPDDEPVNRILVRLVEKLGLPTRHPGSEQMIVYKFHHQSAGQLRDEQTLGAAGVRAGDVLRVYGEIIAG